MGRVEKKKMKDIYQETETQLLNKEKIKIKKQKNKDKNCIKFLMQFLSLTGQFFAY